MAEFALTRSPLVPRIIARKETVDIFWQTFGRLKMPLLFDRRQLVYILENQDLGAAPEPCLRPARLAEAHTVARLASAMSFEEIMLDPYKDYPASYLRLIEQRIKLQRYWVLEEDGQIKFQVHLNGVTPFAGQVTGVYTPPPFRHQGYAARGMGEFCRQVLTRLPRLCLFVNDFNLPAIRLYEKLGFKPAMEYRAIFLDARRV
jgi:RimJ/RimL family protein N-acetyltransferase